jgi:hypothetical protein
VRALDVLLVLVASVVASASVGCDGCDRGGASAGDGGRRYAAVDAGALHQCRDANDCKKHGPGSLCYYPTSDLESPIGVCGGPSPTCAVSSPFCTASGRTIYACTFPTEPWMRRGACADAAAR